jgi:hypothetical protein
VGWLVVPTAQKGGVALFVDTAVEQRVQKATLLMSQWLPIAAAHGLLRRPRMVESQRRVPLRPNRSRTQRTSKGAMTEIKQAAPSIYPVANPQNESPNKLEKPVNLVQT